jgi:deoxycytidylate deaminase
METSQNNIKESVKYPYLPDDCFIESVPESNNFMGKAKEEAKKSNDQQQPTGAVIVCDGKIISEKSNKNPLSSSWIIKLHKKYCIRHLLHIHTGEKYWACPGCATNESHAESRAVLDIQKRNIKDINNPELYLWGHWWCCKPCWDKMLEIGIKKVYLVDDSEILFNPRNPKNILGHQFDK